MNYKLLLFGFLSLGFARISAQTFPLQVKEEKLTYVTDERGNRILDYSSCGYRNSEHPIPDVANAVLFHGSLGIIPLVFSAPLTMYLHWLWIKMVFVGLFCWIKELLN